MDYVLAKDVVIPAGTPVGVESARTSRYHGEWISVTQGPTKDTVLEVMMPLSEALEVGIVKVAHI